MRSIGIILVILSILLVGCGGSVGSSEEDEISEVGDGGGDNGDGGGGDNGDGGGDNGGGSRGASSTPLQAEWSIIPFAEGFSIQWHNLDDFKREDLPKHLSITLINSNLSIEEMHTIPITEFIDGIYNLVGLIDGVAYRFPSMVEMEYSNASRMSPIRLLRQENRLDNNNTGIVVGANYDRDGRANGVDEDDDNDRVLDDDEEASCALNPDCDNDGILDSLEMAGCILDPDCDNDQMLDGKEEVDCILKSDCDNDGVLDSLEVIGCALKRDCDRDGNQDGEDIDDDGDGLIEIRTARELYAVRYELSGAGYRETTRTRPNQTGCGDGERIKVCSGYELVRDISLTDYIADTNSRYGWLPIASCSGIGFTGIFDGNGFEVSGLFINRPRQDCIGLFGQASGTIRHLGVVVDRIIGRNYVGSLVGNGDSAKIGRSYAVSGAVSGDDYVGGLIGKGEDSEIAQSYAVSNTVSGNKWVGGLIGWGVSAEIIQSYGVTGAVSGGDSDVGGLMGNGEGSEIVQSYAVSNMVSGNSEIGGLIGDGDDAKIVHSYVVSGAVNGSSDVGGLVGFGGTAVDTYWDSKTSSRNNDGTNGGQAKDSRVLRSPMGYDNIYSTWDDGAISEGSILASVNHDSTMWCDEDLSGLIEDNERRDDSHVVGDNRVWDLGTSSDYPAIRCTADSLADQRRWWYLNSTTNKPQLDQAYLNTQLNSRDISIPTKLEWTITPFTKGLRIRWHNLADFKESGVYLHLKLSTSNLSQPIRRKIAIEEFKNNSHDVADLINGKTYRFVEVAIEFTKSISWAVPIDWLWEANEWDNNHSGIMVGINYDNDSRVDLVDEDDDNDGVDDKQDGVALDLCPRGELDWISNTTNDHDRDGCRDDGEVNDGYGEDEDDDNDGLVDRDEEMGCMKNLDCDADRVLDNDEEAGCVKNPDCDADRVLDGDERVGCVLKPDCDSDRALDGDEEIGCVLKPDCDGDKVLDGEDECPLGEVGWASNKQTDNDGDGCRDEGRINDGHGEDEDDDNDRLNDEDEVKGCELNSDCDNDKVLDGDEVEGCGLNPDCDDDGELDNVDIDDDGDGLIEIRTARELDTVRYVLDGSGYKVDDTAMLNQTGCGDGEYIRKCSGYELIKDILLTDYITERYGWMGWQPIAPDTNAEKFGCNGGKFTGTFDGNGFEVSGLFINRTQEDCIGLFGQTNGTIRYLGVLASRVIGGEFVGSLMGDGVSTEITRSYVVNDEVSGDNFVGGLVGASISAEITQSYGINNKVKGHSRVGGLVGDGGYAEITQSYAMSNRVNGGGYVGGLVGYGGGAEIVHSYAVSDEVKGYHGALGGLIGYGGYAGITRSYAVSGEVSGDRWVGGLVGDGYFAEIIQSYAVNGEVRGSYDVGGLEGGGWATEIVHSYAVSGTVRGNSNVGGLVGRSGQYTELVQSYAVTDEVRGRDQVGGLVGSSISTELVQSYAVSGEVSGDRRVGGLVGYGSRARSSYWDSETSGRNDASTYDVQAKNSMVLRSPTSYNGIYSAWNEGVKVEGIDDDSTVWCDEDLSGMIDDDEMRDDSHINGDNRVWDFGTDSDYPAIRCTPSSLIYQRAWWYLNTTDHKPYLDRSYLNTWLGSSGEIFIPAEIELKIIPFANGLQIEWHNLISFERVATSIHLNLISSNASQSTKKITIEDFTGNNYEIAGLIDGESYHLVEVVIEFTNNVFRVVPVNWLWRVNEWDNNHRGITVGINYDNDGRVDSVDEDDDNDGVMDRWNGMALDLCPRGELGWISNMINDYDRDGCRDEGEMNGGYGEDEDDDNDGLVDRDEVEGCALKPDCDDDRVLDRDEVEGCVLKPDCDGDRVLDRDEVEGCMLKPDCDNDNLADGIDACPVGQRNWRNNGINDFDGDGCHNDEDLDGDNDGVLNIDEVEGCEFYSDCDGDEVLDGDEVEGCELNPDCDNDEVLDSDEVKGCELNSDCDNDNNSDIVDLDDDGDGLIEIHTPGELDAVRYELRGTGYRENITAMLNQTGCGDGKYIRKCSGYELVRDISLTNYIAERYSAAGWLPIASSCDGGRFSGIFDGNGFKVEGLSINRSTGNCVGLFGRVNGTIRHLGVVTDSIIGRDFVGSLIGDGSSAEIVNSYVLSDEVSGNRSVGSLVGYGNSAEIVNSYVLSGKVRGDRWVGGLMGYGNSAEIVNSYAVSGEVRGGGWSVGGLVGDSNSAEIVNSYAVSGEVRGGRWVGGLMGSGTDTKIVQSYGVSSQVSGHDRIGGLVGSGTDAEIVNSYAVSGEVRGGGRSVGGLVGSGTDAEIVQSYAVNGEVRGGGRSVGGLVGSGTDAEIVQSYVVNGEVSGDSYVGGLVGWGSRATIIQSYAVSSEVSGDSYVGGLVGWGWQAMVDQSYGVSGGVRGISNRGGLVGFGGTAEVSYWDSQTSNSNDDAATGSSAQTSTALRSPTGYNGIYITWDDRNKWCDTDLNGMIESDEMRDDNHTNGDNRVWDFGTNTDYPAIRCTPDILADQRTWWYLNRTNQPELNQTRLNAWLKDGLLPLTSYDGGDKGGRGVIIPSQVQWSIIPIVEGLSIYWYNLGNSSQVGTNLYLNLTSGNSSKATMRKIPIQDFTNDNYKVDGLIDGEAYRFVEVIVEFTNNISRVVPIDWLWQANELDNNNRGIVVGVNHDSDSWADSVDKDDDNDGVEDRWNGTAFDLCPRGELGWVSNITNDYDRDGCRDDGEVNGGYGEDEDDDNDGLADRDEEVGCSLNPDCDGDKVLDGDEVKGCVLNSDCDNDSVLDGDEVKGCELDSNCDNDSLADDIDNCPAGQGDWHDNGTNDFDGDGCRNDEDIDDDGDGLIEVGTAKELDMVRHELSGIGLRQDTEAILNQDGCGDGKYIRRCFGYELVKDISLTDYIVERYSTAGWQPIASCDSAGFTGIFDGNGFEVSGLFVNRSGESCAGLFGRVSGTIRHLGVIASKIIGVAGVGSLVGSGWGAEIIQSYAVSDEVNGDSSVGGLVGGGVSVLAQSYVVIGKISGNSNVGGLIGGVVFANITQSHVVSGIVSGNQRVGGLIGYGAFANITQSYAVSGVVSGNQRVGGLMGHGVGTKVAQSYTVNNLVNGSSNVGGLVGSGWDTEIAQSYAVSSTVSGNSDVGGLVGNSNIPGIADIIQFYIIQSYAVSGGVSGNSDIGGLVGSGYSVEIAQSYWDRETSGRNSDGVTGSSGQTSIALRSPTTYTDIYDTWDDGLIIDSIDNQSTIWCDEDLSSSIESDEMRNNSHAMGGNRVWDFGTSTNYPAIRCTSDSLIDQRAWWYLNSMTHKPQLNQTRLDAWLDGLLP